MTEHGRPQWRKSSYSTAGGNCVEVAGLTDGRVGIRDSKNSAGPVLTVAPAAFTAFLTGIRAGAFDG